MFTALQRKNRKSKPSGFTLTEVLLVVAVSALFAGASVLSFSPLFQQAPFDEGVSRFESILRFARAEAANSGHKIQLQFEPVNQASPSKGYKPVITCETDPLNAPGTFTKVQEVSWMNQNVSELITVESVRSLDPFEDMWEPDVTTNSWSGDEPLITEEEPITEQQAAPATITFFPDGSSDSAEIILISADQEDTRSVQLRLVGLTGSIRQEIALPMNSEQKNESEPDIFDSGME